MKGLRRSGGGHLELRAGDAVGRRRGFFGFGRGRFFFFRCVPEGVAQRLQGLLGVGLLGDVERVDDVFVAGFRTRPIPPSRWR